MCRREISVSVEEKSQKEVLENELKQCKIHRNLRLFCLFLCRNAYQSNIAESPTVSHSGTWKLHKGPQGCSGQVCLRKRKTKIKHIGIRLVNTTGWLICSIWAGAWTATRFWLLCNKWKGTMSQMRTILLVDSILLAVSLRNFFSYFFPTPEKWLSGEKILDCQPRNKSLNLLPGTTAQSVCRCTKTIQRPHHRLGLWLDICEVNERRFCARVWCIYDMCSCTCDVYVYVYMCDARDVHTICAWYEYVRTYYGRKWTI